MAGSRWIQSAIKRKGAFRKKAKRAGMSTKAYARKERSAPGRLGKQARLALTLGKLRGRKKKTAHVKNRNKKRAAKR